MFVVLVVRVSHGHAFDIIMVIYVLSIIATSFCSYVRPETVRDANYEDETLYSTVHFYSAVFSAMAINVTCISKCFQVNIFVTVHHTIAKTTVQGLRHAE
jgi:hypothetical protein